MALRSSIYARFKLMEFVLDAFQTFDSVLELGLENMIMVSSPTDLLHAVIALYNTCLPDVTVQSLYRTVCAEGTKTLLLLRDTSEILQEWESHHLPSSASQSREDSLGEINNNPALNQTSGEGSKEKTTSNEGSTDENVEKTEDEKQNIILSSCTSPRSTPDLEISNQHHLSHKNESRNTPTITTSNISNLTEGHLDEDWRPWTPKSNNNYLERFRPVDNGPEKVVTPLIQTSKNRNLPLTSHSDSSRGDPGDVPMESPFSDVFSDSGAESETGSDMEEEDDHEDFSRGLDAFLRAVGARKKDRRVALERYSLQSTHVGIEHRLIAAATFNKNYRIPGTRVVYLSLLTVRKRFRRCGIGKYILKKLKSPSQVGPYDALVVRADPTALNFFLKNSFTDDLILNSRFRELEVDGCPKGTLLCYLPPFDGHYPPLPGAQDWNSADAMVAMEEEVEKWRQKSLEAYQTQVTCLTRLQQEVLRLHNLLRRQESTIQFLKKENQRLQGRLTKVERKSAQALIDVLEKEAADFERFCGIQYQINDDR
ncbi:n-acetyltransferase domain-containing protein [Trichonephila clavata]|uniref:N-acetyltransferase domain-containing protein n=1 Tax=Trichonephila clavata TaxID=2740835 RepID=A0A8X6LAN3_TRICU|nr:n-acetyltransferase domain-containing protein [Trichonephila clavata]